MLVRMASRPTVVCRHEAASRPRAAGSASNRGSKTNRPGRRFRLPKATHSPAEQQGFSYQSRPSVGFSRRAVSIVSKEKNILAQADAFGRSTDPLSGGWRRPFGATMWPDCLVLRQKGLDFGAVRGAGRAANAGAFYPGDRGAKEHGLDFISAFRKRHGETAVKRIPRAKRIDRSDFEHRQAAHFTAVEINNVVGPVADGEE